MRASASVFAVVRVPKLASNSATRAFLVALFCINSWLTFRSVAISSASADCSNGKVRHYSPLSEKSMNPTKFLSVTFLPCLTNSVTMW